MMMKKMMSALVATMVLATAPAVSNASPLLGYIDSENDCAGVFGRPPNCVAYFPLGWTPESGQDPLLAPTPLIGKRDYNSNGTTSWTQGMFGSITGNEFVVTLNGDGSGSFTYTAGAGDPVLTAFVIKDGNGFWLFSSDGSGGSWTAAQQQGGAGISHISFYDGGGGPPITDVPEPGTVLLVGLALLGLAASRKRHQA